MGAEGAGGCLMGYRPEVYTFVRCHGCGQVFSWTLRHRVRGCCDCGSEELEAGPDPVADRLARLEQEEGRRVLQELILHDPESRAGAYEAALELAEEQPEVYRVRCIICDQPLSRWESQERLVGSTCWPRWRAALR